MADFNALAESLTKNLKIYQDFIKTAGLPPPSHSLGPPPPGHGPPGQGPPPAGHGPPPGAGAGAGKGQGPPPMGPPPPLPEPAASALEAAKEACHELYLLLLNPVELITDSIPNITRALSLNFITTYGIAGLLAPGERKSFKALADGCKLDENDVRRMLRLAMTEHIFEEPEPGMVAHTKASIALLMVPNMAAWAEVFTLNTAIMTELPEAMAKYPGSEVETETASALYRKQKGQGATLWEQLSKNPEQAIKFGKSMEFIASNPALSVKGFVQAYDWSKLPTEAVFVDVGGSHGHAAIAVAEANPKMRCIVQDIAEPTITAARASLSPQLKDRVEYQVYDFWTEQPVKGADVYFFRAILHDWSDSHVVKLLRTLAPSLKAGSRVVANEICLPSPGQASLYKQRMPRTIDLMMKSLANAKERDAGEWEALFAEADSRFKFQAIVQPPKMEIAIIEAIWQP